jgi:hypothetical protein
LAAIGSVAPWRPGANHNIRRGVRAGAGFFVVETPEVRRGPQSMSESWRREQDLKRADI